MKTNEIALFLSEFPLFNTLTESEIMRLSEQTEVLKRPKFNFIYHFDDPSDKFYIIVKGIVKTGLHSDDGREIIKTVLHKGSMFGELGIVGEQKRSEFARAMNEDVVCIAINIKDLRHVMSQNMNLGFNILDKVGERLRKAEAKLEALIFKDARERIIDFIRNTAASRGRRVGFEMMFKHCLTQQDIANLTGTSRQTVTSVLNELRKENKIYFNRRSILIRDMEGLA
jgi:CRP-like cAMP-binding protein